MYFLSLVIGQTAAAGSFSCTDLYDKCLQEGHAGVVVTSVEVVEGADAQVAMEVHGPMELQPVVPTRRMAVLEQLLMASLMATAHRKLDNGTVVDSIDLF